MKINNFNLDKIHPLGSGSKRVSRSSPELEPDVSLKISQLAKKISAIQEEFTAEETQRIQQLRAKIQRGEYKVDPEKIARILLGLEEQAND